MPARDNSESSAAMLDESPSTIQDKHDQEGARIRQISDDYDRDTDHGRKHKSVPGTTIIVIP
jgi:hypothetical protein